MERRWGRVGANSRLGAYSNKYGNFLSGFFLHILQYNSREGIN